MFFIYKLLGYVFLKQNHQIPNKNSKISTIILNITHSLDISLVYFMVEIVIGITMIKNDKSLKPYPIFL